VGLFEVQRELASESARKKKVASTKARALAKDPTSLVQDAWASDLDPKTLEPLYRKLAKKDAALALALARLDTRENESTRALIEENAALIAPLVASRLKTDRAAAAAQLLGNMGERAKLAIPALRAGTEGGSDKARHLWCAWALASIGDADDVAFAAKIAGAKPPPPLTCALAKRGVRAYVVQSIDEVRAWLDTRKKKRLHRDDVQPALAAIEALGEARAEDALAVLHEALRAPYVSVVMRALLAIAHPSSRAPIEAFLAMLAGDRTRNLAYRLPAENVLRAITPRASWASLDAARDVLARLHPERYGWPKVDDWADLVAHAVHALALQGDEGDIATAARFANAPFRIVRDAAAPAFAKIHGAPPALEFWDAARVKLVAKSMRPKAMLDVALRDTTVFRHNLLRVVSKSKDDKTRARLADAVREELEARENYRIEYYEGDGVGPDLHGLFDAVATLARSPSIKKRLASTTSLWIRHHALGQEPSPSDWLEIAPEETPLRAEVTKLGARSRGSFVVGRHANGLAYSNDGASLAVVGDSLGVVVDAQTGATKTKLDLRYNWAYSAVFSKDDKSLYVAYHGGHLEVFDVATGKPTRSLEGHRGVPHGVRGLAISPDGKFLLSAGSDGRALLRKLPSGAVVRKFEVNSGSFYGVAFSRDSQWFALSVLRADGTKHGDGLHVGDTATGKTKFTEMPSSLWALAFAKNGAIACAGEGKHILFLNEKYQPARKLVQGDVVRLGFMNGDRTLVAVSQTGEAKAWDLASGKSTTLDTGDGPLWALAHDEKTDAIACAGTAGIVHRFDASLAKLGGGEPLAMHTKQVRGFAVLPDGRFFSCGWDGRLLLWDRDASAAHVVHEMPDRMTELVLDDAARYLLVLHGKGALCFDVATLTLLGSYAPKITNASTTNPESLAVSGDVVAVGHWGGFVRTFSLPVLEPRGEVSLGKEEVSAMIGTGDGGFICGTEDGRVARLSPSLAIEWTLSDHGSDLVEGEPMGNPHRTVAFLARSGKTLASSATDHTVRLYDISGATPVAKKRFLTSSALFNDVAFSPSGARVIAPNSYGLEIYDAAMGTLLASLDRAAFPDADELTRATPKDEDTLLVGAENGNVYAVKLR
jgi:WD40 repeat protein